MNVHQLVKLLQSMPQEAHVVISSEGPANKTAGFGVMREGSPTDPLLDGFSAVELRKEQIDVFTFEKENIVAICLVTNSAGEEL